MCIDLIKRGWGRELIFFKGFVFNVVFRLFLDYLVRERK